MNILSRLGVHTGVAIAVLSLGACGTVTPPVNTYDPVQAYPQSNYSNQSGYPGYGVVQSIDLVMQERSGIGAGTIAGAVIGGIVGNQVGGGAGNTAATVLGAAGGAYAGHELEKRNQQQINAYKFTIRMNDGTYQTVTQTSNPDIRVGDRVQVDNGVARRF